MFKINPYRPGAGVRPQYLAGRDEDIENVTNMFTALTLNIPTQSVIFSGLRGVGKTVLINRLQEIAEEKNIFCKHIEVAERNDFISQIATCSQAFLRQISVKEKFKNLNIHLGVNINEINLAKEEIKNEYVNNSYNEDFIVNKEYIDEIINCIKDENMYSLRQKSRYGSLNIEGKLKYLEDIEDFNEDEKGGMYSPILVIYRPAKYLRGSYILEDTYYVYIKRQPLNALINQEKLNEKGIDGMGSIIYKKLKHDLTNENLQEILAEIYIYANKNNLNFENIKLTDISSNRLWLTSERLKKEFKELRYYHKNLTQKIKDIYDSTGAYYTQLGGKYIFNTREFAHCYKTYKAKDING